MVQLAGGYGVADLIGNLAADAGHAHLPAFDPVVIFVFFASYKCAHTNPSHSSHSSHTCRNGGVLSVAPRAGS